MKATLKPLIERAAEDLARAGFKQYADALDAATDETGLLGAILRATGALAVDRRRIAAFASTMHRTAEAPAEHAVVSQWKDDGEAQLLEAEISVQTLAQAQVLLASDDARAIERLADAVSSAGRLYALRAAALTACGPIAKVTELQSVGSFAIEPAAWLHAIRATENAVAHAERCDECEPMPLSMTASGVFDAATRTALLRSDQFLRAREALRALRDAAELTLAETFKRAAAAAP